MVLWGITVNTACLWIKSYSAIVSSWKLNIWGKSQQKILLPLDIVFVGDQFIEVEIRASCEKPNWETNLPRWSEDSKVDTNGTIEFAPQELFPFFK